MREDKDKVKILDTTLRDGAQAAPKTVAESDRKKIVDQLNKLNPDIVEAGFAAASELDKRVVEYAAETMENKYVASLARTTESDIIEAANALSKASHPLIHTFIATSPIHMQEKLKKSPEDVLDITSSKVEMARDMVENRNGKVQFSCEDATRSEWNFLKEVCERAIDSGANIINLPDTVGYSQPGEIESLIKFLKENVKGIEEVDISVHNHDDLGRATSTTLEGILAGARQAEVTINGVGERAGNAAMEEVVGAIKARPDFYKQIHIKGIDTTLFGETSELISRAFDMPVQPNKALVGGHAFAHMSGIHQDGMAKSEDSYQIMQPQDWGWKGTGNKITTSSGKNGFETSLEHLGFSVTRDELEEVYRLGMEYMVENEVALDERVLSCILTDKVRNLKGNYSIEEMSVTLPSLNSSATATTFIRNGSMCKQSVSSQYGPVSALYGALERCTGQHFTIDDFTIRAIGKGGRDSKGETLISATDYENNTLYGWGINYDIIKSAAEAYLSVLNKLG